MLTPVLEKGSNVSTGNYEAPLGVGMKFLDSRFIFDLNRGLNSIPEDLSNISQGGGRQRP
jgi:hypothetical protein